jgi:hypothetical protein
MGEFLTMTRVALRLAKRKGPQQKEIVQNYVEDCDAGAMELYSSTEIGRDKISFALQL